MALLLRADSSNSPSRGAAALSCSWRGKENGRRGVRKGGWELPGVRGPGRRSSGKEETQRQRKGRKRERQEGKLARLEAWGRAGRQG